MSTTIPPPRSLPRGGVTVIPDARDMRLAAESRLAMGPLAAATGDLTLTIKGDVGTTGEMRIPAAAVRLLFVALSQMAGGQGVSLLPSDAELRTQEAADLLQISRPYFVSLLERGEMPFRRVGNQRRVRLRDLMDYKARSDTDRHAALDALARLGQEIGVGYEHGA